jgi:hypothetical protein
MKKLTVIRVINSEDIGASERGHVKMRWTLEGLTAVMTESLASVRPFAWGGGG